MATMNSTCRGSNGENSTIEGAFLAPDLFSLERAQSEINQMTECNYQKRAPVDDTLSKGNVYNSCLMRFTKSSSNLILSKQNVMTPFKLCKKLKTWPRLSNHENHSAFPHSRLHEFFGAFLTLCSAAIQGWIRNQDYQCNYSRQQVFA